MAKELTARQQEVLEFIKEFIRSQGYPPTVREIGGHFGLVPRGVFDHLKALERKGFVRRRSSASRSLEVREFVERGTGGPVRDVPIVGRVAAGTPILAVENLEGSVPLAREWCGEGEIFFLKVQGDSMIGAHIMDGDYALVRRQGSAESGDIVVALLEDEATVKRLVRTRDAIVLQPENPSVPPVTIRGGEARRFEIVGKVIGVFRRLP
ncbi:MAG: transcriptional repressor LexA [Deltaproteobacteria bacterium]|nr:transcriptional repressor LexA [Deltaproteobacteria bacterium]